MNLLELKVKKFHKIDQSIRFREAQRLVQEQTTLLNHIKTGMKKQGITEMQIEEPDCTLLLSFNIKERLKVDIQALPDDIKAQYSEKSEIWYKNGPLLEKLV